MIKIIFVYWYLFIIALVVGAILALIAQGGIKRLWRGFSQKASIIKKYWKFVVPFAVIILIVYLIVIIYSSVESLKTNLTILGQVATLIFAIFIGYFAFLQVAESRLEKLKELGHNDFKNKSYQRARIHYEQAHTLNPKDYVALVELLEIYLIVQDYERFDERLPLLKRLIVEDKERAQYHYLKATKFLLKQYLKDAKEEIGDCVKFIKDHPELLARPIWDFSDMKDSDTYKKLKDDTRTILDNFIKYLNRELTEEQKKDFEGGNYLLK